MSPLPLLLAVVLSGVTPNRGAFDPISGVVARGPTIVMLSPSSVDEESNLWWSLRADEFAGHGYRMEQRINKRLRKSPTFRVYRDGKWFTREGWLLRHHLNEFFGKPVL